MTSALYNLPQLNDMFSKKIFLALVVLVLTSFYLGKHVQALTFTEKFIDPIGESSRRTGNHYTACSSGTTPTLVGFHA